MSEESNNIAEAIPGNNPKYAGAREQLSALSQEEQTQEEQEEGQQEEEGQEDQQEQGNSFSEEKMEEARQRQEEEGQEQQEEGTQEEEQQEGQEQQEEQQQEEGQEQGQEESDLPDHLKDNPLIKARQASEESTGINDINDLTQRIKDDLNIEADSPDKVYQEMRRLKEEREKLDEVEKQKEDFRNTIENLPEDLYEAMAAYYEGEDYRNVINMRPNLDFSKTEDDLPEADLVKTYYPDTFTDEDIQELKEGDPDERLKKAWDATVKTAKEKFRSDKEVFSKRQQDRDKRIQDQQQALEQSMEKAVTNFKEKFPGADNDYISSIKSSLQNPTSIFFNDDGTLKDDAAVKLALAEHGQSLVDEVVQRTKAEAKSEARQEEAKKKPSKPDPTKNRGGGQRPQQNEGMSEEAKQRIEEAQRLQRTKTY